MIPELSQIHLKQVLPNLLRVTIRQNNWIAGEIDTEEKIFYSTPRSSKNLFHLFHGDDGGVGINDEILHLDLFDVIKIKFNDKILSTTRKKWLSKGVISPFCNARVDKQLILRLSAINMHDAEHIQQPINQQLEFFSVPENQRVS